ncbi:hypothetical protein D3C78_1480790 [compost metagenome]
MPLDFNLAAEGSIGMCWRDEPHQDSTTLDLLDSLRQAAKTPIRNQQHAEGTTSRDDG